METKKFSDLKGSEKLRIQAAVLQVMEKKNFALDTDLGMKESQDNPENWVMGFTNSEMKLEDLEEMKKILGDKFNVTISPKSRTSFIFRIEAAGEDYFRLLQGVRIPQQPISPQGQIDRHL